MLTVFGKNICEKAGITRCFIFQLHQLNNASALPGKHENCIFSFECSIRPTALSTCNQSPLNFFNLKSNPIYLPAQSMKKGVKQKVHQMKSV